MNNETSRGAHGAHEDERSRYKAKQREEDRIALVRRRESALLPNSPLELAFDAPLDADCRYDNTGFSDGGLI